MTELPCSFLAIIFNIPKIALKICETHFLRIALERGEQLFSLHLLLRKWEVKFIDKHTSTADPNGGNCPHSEQEINQRMRLCVSAMTAKVSGVESSPGSRGTRLWERLGWSPGPWELTCRRPRGRANSGAGGARAGPGGTAVWRLSVDRCMGPSLSQATCGLVDVY